MDLPTTTCEDPVVVISDLHATWSARWRKRLDRLRPLWRAARTMVFNGDTITVGRTDDRAANQQVLEHLSRRCAEDGVRAVFLAGNCDFDLPGQRYVPLAGGKVLITHGEAIFPGVCPWRDVAPRIITARASALETMPAWRRDTLGGQLEAVALSLIKVHDPSRRSRPLAIRVVDRILYMRSAPRRLWAALWAWRQAPQLARRFFEKYAPEAKVIIIGHTHRAGIWNLPGRVLVNTGSITGPGRALTARLQGEQVVVQRIREGPRGYQAGETVARLST